ANLAVLAICKYCGFFLQSFLAALRPGSSATGYQWIVPLGISFYTFRSISYTLDIYQRRLKPTANFADYALFVAFFPELIAGPIERAKQFLKQIDVSRIVT